MVLCCRSVEVAGDRNVLVGVVVVAVGCMCVIMRTRGGGCMFDGKGQERELVERSAEVAMEEGIAAVVGCVITLV